MMTHMPGFQSFFSFFASFCIGKLTTSSISVNDKGMIVCVCMGAEI